MQKSNWWESDVKENWENDFPVLFLPTLQDGAGGDKEVKLSKKKQSRDLYVQTLESKSVFKYHF